MTAEILVSKFNDSGALGVLKKFLYSKNEIIRLMAINTIDRLGDKAKELMSIVRLKRNDPNKNVKKIADYITAKF